MSVSSRFTTPMLALLALGFAGCGDDDATGPDNATAEAALETTTIESPSGAAALITGTTYFVSPTGSNTNAGTQAKPFKTLSKALGVAKSGDIIRLAAGTYSKATNGEQFSLGTLQVMVPAGVTIAGALSGTTRLSILQGGGASAGQIGLNLRGAGIVKNLELRGFNTALRAVKGTQILGNLLLAENFLGIALSDSARTTLTGSTVLLQSSSTGASVVRQANFTMSGGTMSGDATSCELNRFGVALEEHARATLKNGASLRDINGTALSLLDTAGATLTGATVTRTYPAACQPLAMISAAEAATPTLTNAHVTGQGGSHTTGLETKGTGQVTLDASEVSGFTEAGIAVRGSSSKLTVRNQSVLARNHIAIDARFATSASLAVTNTLVSDNDVG